MKTLDQVEPRIPITGIPTNLAAPGSYYLTGNFTGSAGTNGITILLSGVSIDLQGFWLEGVPGSGDGIAVAAGRRNIIIRNGVIRNWGGDGIDAGGASIVNATVLDVHAVSNGLDGIRVNSLSSVLRCTATDNQANGIRGIGIACLVEDCVSGVNQQDGFNLPTSSTISDCTARDNFEDGIEVQGGTVVQNCSSVANDSAGIRVTGPGSVVQGCSATASGTEGIFISARDTYVYGNNCDQNGGGGVSAGILVTNSGAVTTGNRIDSNHLVGNDLGIVILGTSNLVIRNSVSGSMLGTNYQFAAGNSIGRITNVMGAGQFTVDHAWANFEF